jgi:hypothetical protein
MCSYDLLDSLLLISCVRWGEESSCMMESVVVGFRYMPNVNLQTDSNQQNCN